MVMLNFLAGDFKYCNCSVEIYNAKMEMYNAIPTYYAVMFGINFILAILLLIKSEKRKAWLSDELLITLLVINNFAHVFTCLIQLLG